MKETIDIVLESKENSPMFNGQIKGVGPRYCPSIEDKAFRYPEKFDHHIFIEPESHQMQTLYPNGISTSLLRRLRRRCCEQYQVWSQLTRYPRLRC